MKITQSQTRERFPLSTKKVVKKTIAGIVVWLIVFGLGALLLGVSAGLSWMYVLKLFLAVMVVITVITYFYQKWYFAVYFYDLTDNYIVIKKGPITPHEITIPYERVQDIYVDQDLLDRFLGLYDIHLSSATASSGMEAHIDGVEKNAADGLKEILLSTVHQKLNKRQNMNNTHSAI